MKNIESPTGDQSGSPPWLKSVISVLKFVAITFAIYVLARLIVVPFAYEFFAGYLSSNFGIDDAYVRPFALVLTALAITATPTIVFATLFGYQAEKLFAWTLIASIVVTVATYLFADNVYFDRTTGKAQKCYAKTLEGFKFSSTCDFDPNLGIRFQKITPEVAKEIGFWKKSGELKDIPKVVNGKYFNPFTGEAIVWYLLHPDNSISLFSLPGFDTTTGEALKPITKEIIIKYKLDVPPPPVVKNNNGPPATSAPPVTSTVAGGSNADPISASNSLVAPPATEKQELTIAEKQEAQEINVIEAALANGYGQYLSTGSSREALKNVWAMYFRETGLSGNKCAKKPLKLDHDIFDKSSWWSKQYHINGPFVGVEKILSKKQYVLLVVCFSADEEKAFLPWHQITIFDKDARNIPFKSRPELSGLRSNLPNTYQGRDLDHEVDFDLNPQESLRVMLFIKNVDLQKMSMGKINFFFEPDESLYEPVRSSTAIIFYW